jgi:chromosome partitioning protein
VVIVAIANQKGGVGKTTTAINLSACVAQSGYRTLAIDIDPQGNMTSGLGVGKSAERPSIYDVLINETSISQAVCPTPMEHLFLVPANIALAGAEVELVSVMAREYVLQKALETIRDEYDFVFIDCPPSLGLLTLNALTAADKLLVPIQCEFFALEGLTQLMSTVALVRRHLNDALEVEGVVMTMFDSRTNLSQQVVEEVKRFFPNRVYSSFIPRNIRLAEAPSFGLPVVMYDRACTGAAAYASLAQEFILASMEGEK